MPAVQASFEGLRACCNTPNLRFLDVGLGEWLSPWNSISVSTWRRAHYVCGSTKLSNARGLASAYTYSVAVSCSVRGSVQSIESTFFIDELILPFEGVAYPVVISVSL